MNEKDILSQEEIAALLGEFASDAVISKQELLDLELSINSTIARSHTTLDELLNWQVGEFIPIDTKEFITLDVEGTPAFLATLDNETEKRTLRILKKIFY